MLDVQLAQAKDKDIWSYAQAKGCVVITKDEDFSQKATLPGAEVRIVWVRLGNCRTKTLLAGFNSLLTEIFEAFEDGARLVEIR